MKPTPHAESNRWVQCLGALQRLEWLAQARTQCQLSPHEQRLLRAQIARRRRSIPRRVLRCYDTVKHTNPQLYADPEAFPLAVLLTVLTGGGEQGAPSPSSPPKPVCMRFRVSRIAQPLRCDTNRSLRQRRRMI